MSSPSIAVIGGAGYIGSHACKELHKQGFTPIVIDDFSTGHADFVKWGPSIHCSLHDYDTLCQVFKTHKPSAVMHFAAKIDVSESTQNPHKYYYNNVSGTLTLLKAMIDSHIHTLIFSSTAAVYGNPLESRLSETHPCHPLNPYGKSKYAVEQIIQDFEKAYGLKSVIFRYFNAAGADPDTEIGEDHSPETHLIPNIFFAAAGKKELSIYGNDYPTPDGSCIRDYIHVTDLAKAHVSACHYLFDKGDSTILNLGHSTGFSVLEILQKAEQITQKKIPFAIKKRREGDASQLIADNQMVKKILHWSPDHSDIDQILSTSWKWFQHRFV
ncbi:UDP-glucose 4-epimerase GalE [Candidatus Marinamargulisbacteria bacterium SCGC AG-343-D04]|nr:UDP-glucose 4-epimerase GalE [Candidatus Marinamargulisbacteria bacterium SCGC AG-343-D04]